MFDRIRKYIRTLEKEAIPQLSINCVIFGFNEKSLQVIVNKIDIKGTTMLVLPGGYVGQSEDLTDAVERIVRESTGLEKMLFRQFEVFGDASRSFGKEFESISKSLTGNERETFKWFSKRFISVCYLALVDFNKIHLKPTQFLETAQWLPVEKTKVLAMDHSDIVKSARATLIKELPHSPIAANLLPSKFTLPELHALVEGILGREIDRPNFRRKVLKSDVLVKVGQDDTGKRRPADLYTFKNGKKTSLSEDVRFGF
jgi:8-oxo-dGTP diphosphatase